MNGPLRKGKNKSNNLLKGSSRKYENRGRNPFNGPYKKEAFAISLAVLIALLLLLLTNLSPGSGDLVQQTNQSLNQTPEIPTQIYSAGGISFQYPSSWKITTDQINGNTIQLVIQDPMSANNSQSKEAAAFTILKAQKDPYETLEQRKDGFVKNLTASGANIVLTNTTNITVSGINATEAIYNGNDANYNKIELKVVYFEQNDNFYIIAFLTKGIDLESQNPYFNIVLNSFKII